MTTIATSYHPQSAAAIALAPLDKISSSLDSLVQTLQTSTTFSRVPTIAQDIDAADDDLTTALTLLQQHQANYARILHLREEAATLETNIKDIVRRARQLRASITSIHPGIDDDDTTDELNNTQPTVDYTQLLAFAARIGKHNSLAKKEAEEEGTRLKLEAIKARKKSDQLHEQQQQQEQQQQTAAQSAAIPTSDTSPPPPQPDATSFDTTTLHATQLADAAEAFQAHSRLPFPAPDLLRQGALGRLQIIRESDPGDPDGAVEREVERLVRESERVAPDGKGQALEEARKTSVEEGRVKAQQQAESIPKPPTTAVAAPAAVPMKREADVKPPPKKKLDLDFPGDDSDEDDD